MSAPITSDTFIQAIRPTLFRIAFGKAARLNGLDLPKKVKDKCLDRSTTVQFTQQEVADVFRGQFKLLDESSDKTNPAMAAAMHDIAIRLNDKRLSKALAQYTQATFGEPNKAQASGYTPVGR